MDQPYSTRKHDTRDDIMSSWVPVKGNIAHDNLLGFVNKLFPFVDYY